MAMARLHLYQPGPNKVGSFLGYNNSYGSSFFKMLFSRNIVNQARRDDSWHFPLARRWRIIWFPHVYRAATPCFVMRSWLLAPVYFWPYVRKFQFIFP